MNVILCCLCSLCGTLFVACVFWDGCVQRIKVVKCSLSLSLSLSLCFYFFYFGYFYFILFFYVV